MNFLQAKREKLQGRILRNLFVAALSVVFGYCCPAVAGTYIAFYFFSLMIPGVFVLPIILIILIFLASIGVFAIMMESTHFTAKGIWSAAILFVFFAFFSPKLVLPIFGVGFLTFAQACMASGMMRFRFWKNPVSNRQKQVLSFGLILFLYCSLEFLGFLLGQRYYDGDSGAMFSALSTYKNDELSLLLPIWLALFCFRLWLLWDAHHTILEYSNPVIEGRAIE